MVIKVKYNGEWVKIPYLTSDGSSQPIKEAPLDGKQYARKDGVWSVVNIPKVDFTEVNQKISKNTAAIAANTTSIQSKVDKVSGKGLSSNDFTSQEKTKLAGLSKYTLPTASTTVKGGIKVGAGLIMNGEVLSATGGGTADSVAWDNVVNKPKFATVATSGAYNDLTGKPSLAKVATSGSYNDLSNKPTIPTVDVTKSYVDTQLATKANTKDIYTRTQVNNELAGYLTTANAASTYQPKGNYLTSVPAEYITETELTAKNYATTAQVNAKLNSSIYTAADVLSKVKTVDGVNSGLDADLLDGKQGGDYALKTELNTKIGEAPSDGKQYARKNKTWVEVKAMPDGETVKIKVTSNQAQPDASIKGATITVKYLNDTKNLVWNGSELSIIIPFNTNYTISCSKIDGYSTPKTETYTALASNTRNITLSYNTTVTTINITSNQSSSDFVTSVNVNLTDGFTKALSGKLTYTLKIPTGVNYKVTGSAVNVSNTKSYTTPATKQITSTGSTQTISLNYTACKITVTVKSTEGTIKPKIFIDKNSSNIYSVDLASGSSTSIVVPMNSTDKYTVRGGSVSNYTTPGNVSNIAVNSASYQTTITYTYLSEQANSYWVIFDETKSTTKLETGGNTQVKDSIRSKFKRCLAKPQAGGKAVIAYLNNDDSSKWPNGSSSDANKHVDGIYVMVHFPKYYYRCEDLGEKKRKFYISEKKINDSYKEERECLVGAFEASNITRLASWSNTASLSNTTIVDFYNKAKVNGSKWGLIDYRVHKTIANMFAIMYGNTNISTSNSAIPCSGGTRGHVDNVGDTLTIGNKDGKKINSTSFLGLEDCYYGKWEFVQGINIIDGKWIVYDGGLKVNTNANDLRSNGFTNVREIGNSVISSGYITAMIKNEFYDVMPTAVNGSETTYYADNFYFDSGNRIFLRSGSSGAGARCGVFCSDANHSSSDSATSFGSRLAFYGKIEIKSPEEFKKLSPVYTG